MGTKISELTSASSLTGSEELPIVQSGNTKKATINQVKAQNYSTTEQVVGTWIDGKPLYEKVTTAQPPSITSQGTFVATRTAHNISNADYLFIQLAIDMDGTEHINLPYATNAGYNIKATVDTTYVNISSNTSAFNNHTFIFVLRYTKTTDTATRSLNTTLNTMNTGSLVGLGDKAEINTTELEELKSGDTEEEPVEKKAEEAKEEIAEDITEVKESGENDELR